MKQGLLIPALVISMGIFSSTNVEARFRRASFAGGFAGGMISGAIAHKFAKAACHRCTARPARAVTVRHVIHRPAVRIARAFVSPRRAHAPRAVVRHAVVRGTVVRRAVVRGTARPAVIVKHVIKRMPRKR